MRSPQQTLPILPLLPSQHHPVPSVGYLNYHLVTSVIAQHQSLALPATTSSGELGKEEEHVLSC
ncbi:hypothetical protein SESBI_40497 [Sesbania bispinosa]|nr:hypothetical protein SESBI_40497 [Sesbania bispinosa]